MTVSAERVGAAWSAGFAARGSNIHTDGKSVWSWGHHVIGITRGDGRKIADCCHYSQSTATHAGAISEWADEITPCDEPACERVHKGFSERRVHWRRPVVPRERCHADYYHKPTMALRAHPDATCAFKCLFCSGWHPNFHWGSEVRESRKEHHDDFLRDEVATHRLNPSAPDTDSLFRIHGFTSEEEYREFQRLNLIYGDDMQGLPAFETWALVDQTKSGLLAAFPALAEPQPATRLWFVRARNARIWHRAQGPNPPQHAFEDPTPAALCGDTGKTYHESDKTFWTAYRTTPPPTGSLCPTCASLAPALDEEQSAEEHQRV